MRVPFVYCFFQQFQQVSAFTPRSKAELVQAVEDWESGSRVHGDIVAWNTSLITDMSALFKSRSLFNEPIGTWNTASVSSLQEMFSYANAFNQQLNGWNTAKVTSMHYMFHGASKFNGPIGNWNTASVTHMAYMFLNAFAFNQPLGAVDSWSTARVADMTKVFCGASAFNQPIAAWNTASVESMQEMFRHANSFNQPLSTWNTARVSNMCQIFDDASKFCQDISAWSVSPAYSNISLTYNAWPACTSTSNTATMVTVNPTSTSTAASKANTNAIKTRELPANVTVAGGLVEGMLVLKVANASRFVSETNVTAVMKMAVAQLCQVDASWIDVNVCLALNKRLLHADFSDHGFEHAALLRSLSNADSDHQVAANEKAHVRVSFWITIPPSEPATTTADMIIQKFEATSLAAATQVIDQLLRGGMLGHHYMATVVKSAVINKDLPAPAPTPLSKENSEHVVTISILCSFLVLVCCILAVGRLHVLRRYGNLRAKRRYVEQNWHDHSLQLRPRVVRFPDIGQLDISELLRPPDVISSEMRLSIYRYFAHVLHCISGNAYNCDVFIICSADSRECDVEHSGPGLFHAAAVTRTLTSHGVACFGSFPGFGDLETCLEAFADQDTRIQIVIVLETCGLFNSKRCCREIFAAWKNNIMIVRLRFQEKSTESQDWWPMIDGEISDDRWFTRRTGHSWHEMRNLVEQHLVLLSPRPSPPETVQSVPGFLDDFAVEIKLRLASMTSCSKIRLPSDIQEVGVANDISIAEDLSSRANDSSLLTIENNTIETLGTNMVQCSNAASSCSIAPDNLGQHCPGDEPNQSRRLKNSDALLHTQDDPARCVDGSATDLALGLFSVDSQLETRIPEEKQVSKSPSDVVAAEVLRPGAGRKKTWKKNTASYTTAHMPTIIGRPSPESDLTQREGSKESSTGLLCMPDSLLRCADDSATDVTLGLIGMGPESNAQIFANTHVSKPACEIAAVAGLRPSASRSRSWKRNVVSCTSTRRPTLGDRPCSEGADQNHKEGAGISSDATGKMRRWRAKAKRNSGAQHSVKSDSHENGAARACSKSQPVRFRGRTAAKHPARTDAVGDCNPSQSLRPTTLTLNDPLAEKFDPHPDDVGGTCSLGQPVQRTCSTTQQSFAVQRSTKNCSESACVSGSKTKWKASAAGRADCKSGQSQSDSIESFTETTIRKRRDRVQRITTNLRLNNSPAIAINSSPQPPVQNYATV